MKKVLHLASWYPNRKGVQDGDFIQRQLRALALTIPVDVIAVVKDEQLGSGAVDIDKRLIKGVSETIAYYNPRRAGFKKLDALISYMTYGRVFRRLIREHIRVNGKPELIHLHVAVKAGVVARWAALTYGIPYVVSEHWSGYKKEDQNGLTFQPRVIREMVRKVLNSAKLIIPVSAGLWEDIKQYTSNRVHVVVPNVVDESLFDASGPGTNETGHQPNPHLAGDVMIDAGSIHEQLPGDVMVDAGSIHEPQSVDGMVDAELINEQRPGDVAVNTGLIHEQENQSKREATQKGKSTLAASRRFRFLHVSTMGPEKRPEMLLNAFDLFRLDYDAELVCLGPAPVELKEWTRQKISSAQDILFRGNVAYEQVAEEMRTADCLVITSLFETFSCVAVEGLLSGLPLISTPVGVVPDLISPENGLLFQNEAELLKAMQQIFEQRNRYHRRSIAMAQKGKFSYQQVGNKLVELYDAL